MNISNKLKMLQLIEGALFKLYEAVPIPVEGELLVGTEDKFELKMCFRTPRSSDSETTMSGLRINKVKPGGTQASHTLYVPKTHADMTEEIPKGKRPRYMDGELLNLAFEHRFRYLELCSAIAQKHKETWERAGTGFMNISNGMYAAEKKMGLHADKNREASI